MRERHQRRFEAREQGLEPRDRHAGLVIVEQRVVPLADEADGIGFLARQREDAVEPGREALEVVPLARVGPGLRRARRHPGRLLDQPPGLLALPIEVAAQLAHVHRLRALGVPHQRGPLERAEQLVVTGIGAAVVHEPREQRHLLGAVLHAAARHRDLLVPLEQVETGREEGLVAREAHQFLVGLFRFHVAVVVRPPNMVRTPAEEVGLMAAAARQARAARARPDPARRRWSS